MIITYLLGGLLAGFGIFLIIESILTLLTAAAAYEPGFAYMVGYDLLVCGIFFLIFGLFLILYKRQQHRKDAMERYYVAEKRPIRLIYYKTLWLPIIIRITVINH